MSTANLRNAPALPGIQTPIPAAPWFRLNRHDDPDPEPDPADPAGDDPNEPDDDPAGDPAPEGDDPDEPDDDPDPEGLGDAGRQALARMKAERAAAKKEAAQAKLAAAAERRKAAALEKKVQDFEDRDKSELEKATAARERAEKQAAAAVARTVAAEVKVGAAGRFLDVTDATDALMRDPSKYVDSDGEIDTAAIQADLDDLLERKPHFAVPAADPAADPAPETKPKKQRPQPDPGQGSRGPTPAKDFRTVSKEEHDAELRKLGLRPR